MSRRAHHVRESRFGSRGPVADGPALSNKRDPIDVGG
jgi:hypothetical protein